MGSGQFGNRTRRPYPWRIVASLLAVVLIVLATVLTLNDGALPLGRSHSLGNPTLVFIDGINRTIAYKGNITGDFGPEINDSCPHCPLGAQEGGAIRVPIATWYPPTNLSFWVFTNVSGPFPVQGPSCSPAPCTLPWIAVWSFQTYVPADVLTSMTLFATFQLLASASSPNIVDLNATFCPSWVCAPPPPA